MAKASSENELGFIHEGVTVTVLAQIFGLDHKDVNRRLIGKITPMNQGVGSYMKYRIRDAAPYLIDLQVNPEELIKSLSPSKLPPALQDAFWKAQLSRQRYDENRGDLWRTPRVIEVLTTAFKVIAMTIRTASDNIGQQTKLTDDQRKIIERMMDGLLEELNRALIEEFEMYVPAEDEHGAPLGNQTIKAVDDAED